MFTSLLDNLRAQIGTVKLAMITHAGVRDIVTKSSVNSDLEPLKSNAPPLADWRVYDHCAAFIRLYAIYERFIKDIVENWLREQPSLRPDFCTLPEKMRTAYRVGVADVLQKYGGDRYSHLTEASIVEGLSLGLAGKPYTLLVDAFFINDQNLRLDALGRVMASVGIPDVAAWLKSDVELNKFLDEIRGGQSTCESELKDLVRFRNIAAHEVSIEEIVGPDEFAKYADFVTKLCAAIHDFVCHHIITLKLANRSAIKVAKVIKRFSDNVVGVECPLATLANGDDLFVYREAACYGVKIESIQVEGVVTDRVSKMGDTKVGLKLSRPVKQDADLVMILSFDVKSEAESLRESDGQSFPALASASGTDVAAKHAREAEKREVGKCLWMCRLWRRLFGK